MNHVFLSGTVNSGPQMVSQGNEIAHAVLKLTVTHKTATGVEKQEQYPISAWRGIAKRMTEMITPGSRVSVKGYLSQKQTPEGIYLEVTAEEFQVSARPTVVRPLRRNAFPFRAAADAASSEKGNNAAPEHSADMVSGAFVPEQDSTHDL